jgi:hypothetical protein
MAGLLTSMAPIRRTRASGCSRRTRQVAAATTNQCRHGAEAEGPALAGHFHVWQDGFQSPPQTQPGALFVAALRSDDARRSRAGTGNRARADAQAHRQAVCTNGTSPFAGVDESRRGQRPSRGGTICTRYAPGRLGGGSALVPNVTLMSPVTLHVRPYWSETRLDPLDSRRCHTGCGNTVVQLRLHLVIQITNGCRENCCGVPPERRALWRGQRWPDAPI